MTTTPTMAPRPVRRREHRNVHIVAATQVTIGMAAAPMERAETFPADITVLHGKA